MLRLLKFYTFLVTYVLLLFYMLEASAPDPVISEQKVVFCYWGTWSHNRPGIGKFQVSNIDPQLCTHLGYAFFSISEESTIKSRNPHFDIDLENIRNAVGLKQINRNLKVMASVGGGSEGSIRFSDMAADVEKRCNFTTSVVEFLLEYGFDGLDLDWEYPAQRGGQAADYTNFINLLRELKQALKPHKLYLSVAVAAVETSARISYDIGKMSIYVDFINMMTYDFTSAKSRVLGFNSPLKGAGPKTVEASIAYWLQRGASANNLLLGIPLYGRTFTLANKTQTNFDDPNAGAGIAGPYTRNAGILSYYEICAKFREGNWTYAWDESHLVPYAYKDDQWISYDNKQSVELKLEFVKLHNLHGVIVWAIDLDDFQGVCGEAYALLKVIHKGIRSDELDMEVIKNSVKATSVSASKV